MVAEPITWNLSQDDWHALERAISHNCECPVPSTENPYPQKCLAHLMLVNQESLDHLSYGKTMSARLQAEEWRKQRRKAEPGK